MNISITGSPNTDVTTGQNPAYGVRHEQIHPLEDEYGYIDATNSTMKKIQDISEKLSTNKDKGSS